MARNPDNPKKPGKPPKSKAHRRDVQPIGPALAELLNPAINRGESGIGSSTGLQPPPDNSWDRRAGGEGGAAWAARRRRIARGRRRGGRVMMWRSAMRLSRQPRPLARPLPTLPRKRERAPG